MACVRELLEDALRLEREGELKKVRVIARTEYGVKVKYEFITPHAIECGVATVEFRPSGRVEVWIGEWEVQK